MIVQQELDRIGIPYLSVELGKVETENMITCDQLEALRKNLQRIGLEIMEDKKSILINRIKCVVIEMIQYNKEEIKVNYSEYISEKIDYDYTYLSNIFSEEEGITIQQFKIIYKIERVKEYLLYDELSLTEISDKMNYSSVSHLSSQFKKITGMTPSLFFQMEKTKN